MASGRYGPITITSKGSTKNVRGFFKKTRQKNFVKYLDTFGKLGVELLAMDTPVDTAETALSWDYEILEEDGRITLTWTNSAMDEDGDTPVVILIMYGHATRNGGYVAPYDFVNPIMNEIFQAMADTIWREVQSS